MKLSVYARDIIGKALAGGHASNATRARDPLIRPFSEFDEQIAALRTLQESTRGMCWIDSKCKLIPINEAAFAGVQADIQRLQSIVDHNAAVLNELDVKVSEIGLSEFSIGSLNTEKKKLLERINQIKADEIEALRPKWHAVVIIGGDRGAYDKLPEVIEAKAKTAASIAPLEAEIDRIDDQVKCLQSILGKIKRQ